MLIALLGTLAPPLSAQQLDTTRLWELFQSAATEDGSTQDGLGAIREARGGQLGEIDRARLDAYEGAFRTMTAQETLWPPTKLSRAREGLALLDAAVDAAPDDPEVRYLRLVICHNLPGLFRRGDTARDDAAALTDLLLSGHLPQDAARTTAMIDFLLSTSMVSGTEAGRLRLLRIS